MIMLKQIDNFRRFRVKEAGHSDFFLDENCYRYYRVARATYTI